MTRSGSSSDFTLSSYHLRRPASSSLTASASFLDCEKYATRTVNESVMSASAWSSSMGEAQVAAPRTACPTRMRVMRRLRNASKRSGVREFSRKSRW